MLSPDDVARALANDAPMSAPAPPPVRTGGGPNPYIMFKAMGENDILLLFGKTKAGKSRICITTAIAARQIGKRVVYYDTEKNIHKSAVDALVAAGVDYRPTMHLKDIYRNLNNIQADLLVIDSATIGITGKWFDSDMSEHGQLLLEVQHLYYQLKIWTEKNKSLAMIVAQPISEFGDREFAPMGDKSNFLVKEIFWVDRQRGPDYRTTRREIRAFDSRVLPDSVVIAQFETTPVGVSFTRWGPEVQAIADKYGGIK
jgi:hypothetical protein